MERESGGGARTRPRSGVALGLAILLAAFAFANAVAFMSFSESTGARLVAANESQLAVVEDVSTPPATTFERTVVPTTPAQEAGLGAGLTPGGVGVGPSPIDTGLRARVDAAYAAARRTLLRIGLLVPRAGRLTP